MQVEGSVTRPSSTVICTAKPLSESTCTAGFGLAGQVGFGLHSYIMQGQAAQMTAVQERGQSQLRRMHTALEQGKQDRLGGAQRRACTQTGYGSGILRDRACGMDMRSDDWMKKWPWKLLTRTPLLHRMRMTASQPAALSANQLRSKSSP